VLELLGDLGLESTPGRPVPAGFDHAFGQVGLASGIAFGLLVGVAVVFAVSESLHELSGGVAQMDRHLARGVSGDVGARRVVGKIGCIALRRGRQIQDRLGEREFAFGRSESLIGRRGISCDLQRARIGQTDVLPGHAHNTPRQIARVSAAIEHAAKPIEGRIRMRAAHGLVQGRNLIVEGVAPLVEAAQILAQGAREQRRVNLALARRQGRARDLFQVVQKPARIAIGARAEDLARRLVEFQAGQFRGARIGHRAQEERVELFLIEALEHIDGSPGEQCTVHLERGILGGCANEDEQPRFDMRQEGVLLALVEPVDLIDEQERLAPRLGAREFGPGDRLADFLHPGEDRG